VNAQQTQVFLFETLKICGDDRSASQWLADQGINESGFDSAMSFVLEHPELEGMSPRAMIGFGFHFGWEAHKLKLRTPVEPGPAPDLADSLE
jgi:hypothetical protein